MRWNRAVTCRTYASSSCPASANATVGINTTAAMSAASLGETRAADRPLPQHELRLRPRPRERFMVPVTFMSLDHLASLHRNEGRLIVDPVHDPARSDAPRLGERELVNVRVAIQILASGSRWS
jgi:hypothetical protein